MKSALSLAALLAVAWLTAGVLSPETTSEAAGRLRSIALAEAVPNIADVGVPVTEAAVRSMLVHLGLDGSALTYRWSLRLVLLLGLGLGLAAIVPRFRGWQVALPLIVALPTLWTPLPFSAITILGWLLFAGAYARLDTDRTDGEAAAALALVALGAMEAATWVLVPWAAVVWRGEPLPRGGWVWSLRSGLLAGVLVIAGGVPQLVFGGTPRPDLGDLLGSASLLLLVAVAGVIVGWRSPFAVVTALSVGAWLLTGDGSHLTVAGVLGGLLLATWTRDRFSEGGAVAVSGGIAGVLLLETLVFWPFAAPTTPPEVVAALKRIPPDDALTVLGSTRLSVDARRVLFHRFGTFDPSPRPEGSWLLHGFHGRRSVTSHVLSHRSDLNLTWLPRVFPEAEPEALPGGWQLISVPPQSLEGVRGLSGAYFIGATETPTLTRRDPFILIQPTNPDPGPRDVRIVWSGSLYVPRSAEVLLRIETPARPELAIGSRSFNLTDRRVVRTRLAGGWHRLRFAVDSDRDIPPVRLTWEAPWTAGEELLDGRYLRAIPPPPSPLKAPPTMDADFRFEVVRTNRRRGPAPPREPGRHTRSIVGVEATIDPRERTLHIIDRVAGTNVIVTFPELAPQPLTAMDESGMLFVTTARGGVACVDRSGLLLLGAEGASPVSLDSATEILALETVGYDLIVQTPGEELHLEKVVRD